MKRTFCVQNTKRSNIDFNHMPSFYKVLDIRLPLPLLFFARLFNQLEPFPMILHLHFMIFGHDRQFRFPFLVIADRLLSFILCFFFAFVSMHIILRLLIDSILLESLSIFICFKWMLFTLTENWYQSDKVFLFSCGIFVVNMNYRFLSLSVANNFTIFHHPTLNNKTDFPTFNNKNVTVTLSMESHSFHANIGTRNQKKKIARNAKHWLRWTCAMHWKYNSLNFVQMENEHV